jgi:small subunit ribosomal protein S1
VHISELAAHHVENPREVVQPGDVVRVKVLEIDSERRRLSLSIKRVEGQELPSERRAREAELAGVTLETGDLDDATELGLSEDVFSPPNIDPALEGDMPGAAELEAGLPVEAADVEADADESAVDEPVAEAPAVEEPVAEAPAVEEPVAEAPAVEEPVAEAPAVEEPDVPGEGEAAAEDGTVDSDAEPTS